ncbi:MAG TPA: SRPBCC domain-containing protein, partial [Pseudonocardiaceae bacterium]
WDARTGGSYRYSALSEDEEIASFYGSFHEVRPDARLVQTFTYEGVPDGVCLETVTFDDLGDGRTRITSLSVVDTMEGRDAIMASGMEVGVIEGYDKLDALLAEA